jgi:outer membrane protein OmpA-like peptidoglycan-associated protein
MMLFCLVAFATIASAEDLKGMIKSRAGDSMIVKTDSGDVTVALTDDTRTKDDRGLFGLEKEEMSNSVLIPGLKVKVEGTRADEGHFTAKTITVDGDDIEASQMIAAGLHPTAEQVAANVQRLESHQGTLGTHQQMIESNQSNISANQQNIGANKQQIEANIKDIEENEQRFARLDDYDVKGQTTVKFPSGSAKISAADQKQLKELAQTANQLPSYLIEVTGFADSVGNAAMNTTLSETRAKAVVTYLVQQCGVPGRRIVAPGAMGEYGSAAPNETKTGRAQNRRAEVKVLVNKGIAGGAS